MIISWTKTGQTRGQPLQIHLLGSHALWLDEHRVLLLLWEVDELAVDGGTVSWTLAAHRAGLQRAEMEMFGNHFMRSRSRVGQEAGDLTARSRRLPVREGQGRPASPSWRIIRSALIVVPSMRGGVADWKRSSSNPAARRLSDRRRAGNSPTRPAAKTAIPDHDLAPQEGTVARTSERH